jgi:hypothetical protein
MIYFPGPMTSQRLGASMLSNIVSTTARYITRDLSEDW